MKSFTFLCFLCALMALGWADDGLCTPDQWEGAEGSVGGYSALFKSGVYKEYSRVSYDYTNRRSVAFITVYAKGYEGHYQTLKLYNKEGNEGRLFVKDLKKDKCWAKDLEMPFRRACIPKKAKFGGDFSLGLKGQSKMSSYSLELEHVTVDMTIQKVKGGAVIPIGEIVYGKVKRVGFLQNIGFVDITPGIKNETVFDIPSGCDEANDVSVSLMQELTREHFILSV